MRRIWVMLTLAAAAVIARTYLNIKAMAAEITIGNINWLGPGERFTLPIEIRNREYTGKGVPDQDRTDGDWRVSGVGEQNGT